jgi:antitoxin (DNA-binding transcriptional repressor) of toxin-antitoxin stability system
LEKCIIYRIQKKCVRIYFEVEHGETIILLRRGKPLAEVQPISKETTLRPLWKKPGIRLKLEGRNLTTAILQEREKGS